MGFFLLAQIITAHLGAALGPQQQPGTGQGLSNLLPPWERPEQGTAETLGGKRQKTRNEVRDSSRHEMLICVTATLVLPRQGV